MSIADSDVQDPTEEQQTTPQDEKKELLNIVKQLTGLLADKASPRERETVPAPNLTTLLPAVKQLLDDPATSIQTRDRHELACLAKIADALETAAFEQARGLCAERLQTLISTGGHTPGAWQNTR